MRDDYLEAKRLGDREYRRCIMQGRYPYLPALDDILDKEGKFAEVAVGVTEIPLDMVVGTKTRGRQQAFADDFMPLMKEGTEFAFKWADLFDAHINEGIRDPIKAYEYMQKFYVLEGNKRVSVLKFNQVPFMSADVIRVLPVKTDDKANRIYYEFVEFYKVAPIYYINFSEEGYYARFAETIGQDLEHPWSTEVLQNVKAAFATFNALYKAKGGEKLDITAGDAFLIYLTIYPLDSLLNEATSLLSERLDKLWNEFLTETNDNKIALVETPEAIRKSGSILDVLSRPKIYTKQKPLKVCFIHAKNAENSSWIYGHELGRNYIQSRYDGLVETSSFENCVNDTMVRDAIDLAVKNGNEMIFTTSPAQMSETLRSAIHYPNIKFLNCSLNLAYNSVRTYYGKMFEPKYLMGALAATIATNHKIGYLADYPIYGTTANINAFAIGAAMVDPRVKIHLKWSTVAGTNWQQEFREEGVYIISGPDLIKPEVASREYGIYELDPLEDGKVINLAAPVWNWGKYYELILRTVLDDSWGAKDIAKKDTALNYWYGFKSGVVDVILSDKLSYYTAKMIEALKAGIMDGTLSPFDGELHSQDGIIKGPQSERLSWEEIITMNWLNDNVVGSIPKLSDLNPEARATVLVSGVLGETAMDGKKAAEADLASEGK